MPSNNRIVASPPPIANLYPSLEIAIHPSEFLAGKEAMKLQVFVSQTPIVPSAMPTTNLVSSGNTIRSRTLPPEVEPACCKTPLVEERWV